MPRRFQFSLRALMLAAVVAAVPCAIVGSKINDKRRERAIIEDLRSRKAVEIQYDWHPVRRGKPLPRRGYDWCRKLLGDDFFDTIISVRLSGDVSDVDMAKIATLNWLQEVTIKGFDSKLPVNDRITDVGLAHLKRLRALKSLVLYGTAVTHAGIAGLKEALPECRVVHYR
jgi:hypothetical protein